MTDKLAQTFGVTPLHQLPKNALVVDGETGEVLDEAAPLMPVDESVEQAQEDFDTARENLKDMLEKSKEVFDIAKEVALQAADDKSITAFTKVLDSVVKTQKTLMEMHHDMAGLKPPLPSEPEKPQNVTNVIFQGSTSDFISEMKSKFLTKEDG